MKAVVLAVALAAAGTVTIDARADGASQLRPVVSCALSDGSRATLKARSSGPDGNALFVQVGNKAERAFLDMPDSDFVGRIVLSTCIDRTLIFALEYGPPYLKGVAIRRNPRTHADERIYFAEKALPRWVYLGDSEMLVVIQDRGSEANGRYVIYRYISGKGQTAEPTISNVLPERRGRKVLFLKTH
ncbi:hypothetical protein DR64_4386 [Paraburkholderia xenovorans LB400]|uniref:Uncharacterized protein n=1 Tax=Paraburkholderia xenovorans (strain LB400) TaxID=266265 RepID=Q13YV5_PARXL|nr:hypothetical protein [Paraburkholderia xenovorans]ABE30734.1 Conserved hypothetical protein [Paraburkholderia xenovorans LB400]AIP31349.1 hypothetical protein DR64_4386 [Paraburkholderia xenovorans LB400]